MNYSKAKRNVIEIGIFKKILKIYEILDYDQNKVLTPIWNKWCTVGIKFF